VSKTGIGHPLRKSVGSWGRRVGSIGCVCIIVAMVTVVVFGIRQSSAAGKQPSAGKASGTLTIDEKGIALKYSYAMAQPNTFDAAKSDTAVLLTSKPLSEGALEGVEDLMDAAREQHGWAFFKINSEGKPIYEVIDHPSVDGRISMSGFTHADFQSKKMDKHRVEGTFQTSKPEDFMKYKYQIKVDFSAPLLKAKLPEPLPDAKTGKALPADGGEPGKVYSAYRKAIKDKDIAALRKTAPPSQRKDMSDSDLEKGIEFMAAISPGDTKITRGYVKGDRAVLYVEGVLDGEKQYGTIEMAAEGKTWFIAKESWSNTPPK
jgi:hypothetical protein